MKKLLLSLCAASALLSAAETNYALRSNGASMQGRNRADRAIDGNPKTYWGVDPYPRTFLLKLAGAYKINRMRLIFPSGGNYTFKAEYSLDNDKYFVLAEGRAKDSFELSFPEKKIQFIRFTMLHNTANTGVHLSEIELYGPAGQKAELVKSAPVKTEPPAVGKRPDFLKTSLLPKKVTCSSFVKINWRREFHEPELCCDGVINDDRRYWAPDYLSKARPPHWVEFDFGKPRTFRAVRLDMIERYNLTALVDDFKVEYWDGTRYVPVVDVKGHCSKFLRSLNTADLFQRYRLPTPQAHLVYTFAPVTAQKVRFITTDGFARLDEMTFFEKDVPKEPKAVQKTLPPDGVTRLSFAPEGAVMAPGFARPRISGKTCSADRLLPDELRRYSYCGKDNTVTVNLAPGFYHIWAISGDLFCASPGAVLECGKDTLVLEPSKKGDFFHRTAVFEVKKSPMTIKLKGEWVLNALLIAPVAQYPAFETAMASAVIGKMFPACRRVMQPTNTKPCAFKGDFCWYTVPAEQRVFRRTAPKAGQNTSLEGVAFPGMTKSFSQVFYAVKDFPRLAVEATTLRCGKSELKVAVHPVRLDFQRIGHKGRTPDYDHIPEMLGDNRPLFVSAGTSQQYYLLVDVPENAAPGVYTGSLKWNKGSLPVRLEVIKAKIDPLFPKQTTALYQGRNVSHSMTDPKYRAEWLALLADWKKHNMNMIFYPGVIFRNKEQFAQSYQYVNALLDEAGYPDTILPYHRSDNSLLKREAIQAVAEISKAGKREIVFYPVDEPFNGKQALAMKMYPLFKSVPGTRTYSTVLQRDVDMFGKYLDFRAYNISQHSGWNPQEIHRQCRRDNAVFFWDSNSAREYPDVCRFKAGFFQYKAGAAGQTYWAYDSPNGDAFCDFDGYESDHNTIYSGAKRFWSTIQYEAIRDGLDDLRLCYTLERLAGSVDSIKAVEAQKLLEKIKDDTVIDLALYRKKFGHENDIHQKCFWEPEKFENYRKAMLKLIAELQK